MSKINFVFFGGEPLAVPTLERMYAGELLPTLIVCNPDRPQGRNLEVAPPPTKVWSLARGVPVLQPEKFDEEVENKIRNVNFEFFVVVAYGKIIPKNILNLAKLGTLNTHPSLLPKYRGPSPIIAAILNGDSETGMTIIKLDEEMDHGPMLAQQKIKLIGDEYIEDLEQRLASLGGEMLLDAIPKFAAGSITPREQDHNLATFTKKIKKEDGEIKLDDSPIKNYNKFRAYAAWPRTFFFKNGKRIIITAAALENNLFVIKKVLPEGKREITWEEFSRQE